MRRKFLISFFVLVALCPLFDCKAAIEETNDFAHALSYLKEGTLFVFDLDNTLIETAQHLGSDQWFTHRMESLLKQGLSLKEAFDQVLPQSIEIHKRTEMRLVDPNIPQHISQIRKNNVPMIGLTKRDPVLSERTLEQVAPLQIDFSQSAHLKEELVFEELNGTMLKKGIIFVGHGIEKGPALVEYLKKLQAFPKLIVVIDDKISHLQNIENSLKAVGIDFIGIRYGGADERVKAFDPKVADFQWEHLEKILSNEQALHLIQAINTNPRN